MQITIPDAVFNQLVLAAKEQIMEELPQCTYPKIPRMRTVPEAMKQIREEDPNTCVTLASIQDAIRKGRLTVVEAGNKKLINYDYLIKLLSSRQQAEGEPVEKGKIRKIV